MDHGRISGQFQNPCGSVSIDRVPQWSHQETQDFLMIRAELDPNFVEIKRNKLLWESVSARMNEIGYNRSPLQCKSKWKNLITRYKGCETMQELEMRQQAFPFYNDMQTIFNTRMQRMAWQQEAEGGGGAATSPQGEGKGGERRKKRKESGGGGSSSSSSSSTVEGLKEVMEDYMKQQMEVERRWMKVYEEREGRRREREMEWRQRMEATENERLMMMRRWREREEQRKMREEARAVRRDALVAALLNKINRPDM